MSQDPGAEAFTALDADSWKQPLAWMVLKFGGTSVSKRSRWDNIGTLSVDAAKAGKALIVVSALSGVTDQLKALGEDPSQVSILTAIRSKHDLLLEECAQKPGVQINAIEAAKLGLNSLFQQLEQHIKLAPHINSEPYYPWLAELLSFGELCSSTLGAHYLRGCGLDIWWLDARMHLRSIDTANASAWNRYLSVNCEFSDDAELRKAMADAPIWITQGFIARNAQGQTTILGRGGSDTSASYFGAKLGAKEVQIWTDVPGMFSTNPKRVPDARVLQRLDYFEAQEIAATGAKVLHPRCLLPVREAEIPLRIKDTDRPELEGTLIAAVPSQALASIKAISLRSNITLVSMESLGMWQQVGFLSDVFTAFKRHGLSVDLIGSSETNVTVSLDPSDNLLSADVLQKLCEDLSDVCRVKVIAPCAALTLVGRGIRSLLHRLNDICADIGAGRVHLLTQSSNDLNITFVIDEDRADALLPALHKTIVDARLLPLDQPAVMGPSWQSLYAAPVDSQVTQPWWQRRRAALLQLGQSKPSYVCDLEEVRARALELRGLNSVDQWFYATKANSHRTILQTISEAGLSIECVSWAEVQHVRQTLPQLQPAQILFSPNFAPKQEYADAVAAGVQLTLDNLFVLQQWPELFQGKRAHLRLDLGYGKGHHSKVNTGGERSKFGLSLNDLAEFLSLAQKLSLRIVGLHAHLGSGIRELEHWPRVFAELASIAERIPSVRTLNLGGGLGVPSRAEDTRLDLAQLNARLSQLKALYPQFQIRMEPGRYLVAEAAVLLARVTQVKSKGQGRFVGLDTGMNSLIRPALYDSYHHICNLTRLDSAPSAQPSTVVGPICESGDILGEGRYLPDCQEGDVMLIAEAGAYGAVMSSHYNLREPATELFMTAADWQQMAATAAGAP